MLRAPLLVLVGTLAATPLAAQRWVRGDALDLVRRAVDHRTRRDADTALAAWRAEARGIVRFASVVDHGNGPVERVIRADELRVEVYGEAPNRSKQVITAWRDTLFLPNRVRYHRDHLGIVASDFGGTIRLGEGDEVRDLVHPLSPAGLALYEFALGDTLRLIAPTGTVRVVAVEVRPVDATSPATVGTLYLDVDRAALVRFRFTFTPAAYRDGTVENITVTLENSLHENARWLPWRQAIVIRRGTPWVDLPLRTVLRADWAIDDYDLGIVHPADRFAGPPLAGLRAPVTGGAWEAPLALRLDALPATDADIDAVRRDAARALGSHALDGLPGVRLFGGGVSDFLRVNRVQGVVPSVGTRIRLGASTLKLQASYGTADRRMRGRVALDAPLGAARLVVDAQRALIDVADVPVISGALNSLRTAFGGDDLGDWVAIDRATVGARFGGATRVAVDAGVERTRDVAARFGPVWGTAKANPALGAGEAGVARLSASRRARTGDGWTIDAELGWGDADWTRIAATGATRLALGPGSLTLDGMVGVGSDGLPGYRSFVLGGRGALPGVAHRSLGGTGAAWARIGWNLPVAIPVPPVHRLLRQVTLPSTIGPFVAAGAAWGDRPGLPWRGDGGVEPVAGLRLDLWGPLLRAEFGASLRRGTIGVTIDVHHDWWPVL